MVPPASVVSPPPVERSAAPVQATYQPAPVPGQAATGTTFDQKLHITMIVAAGLGAVLTFTTWWLALIGVCAGATFVLSIRLYLRNKANNFAGTKKLDWVLVMIAASIAIVSMLVGVYWLMGCGLIFVAVRALLMYFASNSRA